MKTECKKLKNTQNILLDGCYLILRSILKRKKSVFALKPSREIGKTILKKVYEKVNLLSPVQTDATLLANNSQHCWVLHVASVCTPCCMLLDVVACCCAKFETGQTFQPTTPNIFCVPWSLKRSATMLDPFAQLFQHCWGPRTLITHGLQRLMGSILPTMHCRSQHCWEL